MTRSTLTINYSLARGKSEPESALAGEVRRRFHVVVLVLVAIVAIVPIFLKGIPVGGDLANHFRFAMPFYDSIHSGHLYPGWLAESNAGFGDPRFRFYPPGLYYLLAAVHSVAGWYVATLVSFVCLSILGSLGIYFWARTTQSPSTAMWAGILYTFAPYHLNELYQASLLSEYAASAVLPFVFLFIDRICARPKIHYVGGLAAAYAVLVLTNLPLLVISSIAALVFALVRLEKANRLKTLGLLTLSVTLGLAASSFFWVRMFAELSWIKGSSVVASSYYDYNLNFLFSSSALTNRNTWYANILGLVTIAYCLPCLILLRRHLRQTAWQLRAVIVVTAFTFLMATPLSKPLWVIIPKLSEVQFPWRWLAVTSLFGSFLMAVTLSEWAALLRSRVRPTSLVPLFGFALACVFIMTQVVFDSEFMNKQQFEEFLPTLRQGLSFKIFLPKAAIEIAEMPRMQNEVETATGPATIRSWEPERRQFDVSPTEAAQNVRVRTYFYPHWKAWADGKPTKVSADEFGVAVIALPAQTKTVEMGFEEPQRSFISGLISLLSALLIGAASLIALLRRPSNMTVENGS